MTIWHIKCEEKEDSTSEATTETTTETTTEKLNETTSEKPPEAINELPKECSDTDSPICACHAADCTTFANKCLADHSGRNNLKNIHEKYVDFWNILDTFDEITDGSCPGHEPQDEDHPDDEHGSNSEEHATEHPDSGETHTETTEISATTETVTKDPETS